MTVVWIHGFSVIIVSLYKAMASCAMWKLVCGVVLEEWDVFFFKQNSVNNNFLKLKDFIPGWCL